MRIEQAQKNKENQATIDAQKKSSHYSSGKL